MKDVYELLKELFAKQYINNSGGKDNAMYQAGQDINNHNVNLMFINVMQSFGDYEKFINIDDKLLEMILSIDFDKLSEDKRFIVCVIASAIGAMRNNQSLVKQSNRNIGALRYNEKYELVIQKLKNMRNLEDNRLNRHQELSSEKYHENLENTEEDYYLQIKRLLIEIVYKKLLEDTFTYKLGQEVEDIAIKIAGYHADELVQLVQAEKKPIVIYGEAGVGKTYNLLKIMQACIKKDVFLPIYLPATAFINKHNIRTIIYDYYRGFLEEGKFQRIENKLMDYLEFIVKNWDRVLLLIDGLDEVQPETKQAIQSYMNNEMEHNYRIIITCRTSAYHLFDHLGEKNYGRFQCCEITDDNVHDGLLLLIHNMEQKEMIIQRLIYLEVNSMLLGIMFIINISERMNISKQSLESFSIADLFYQSLRKILKYQFSKAEKIYGHSSIDIDFDGCIELLAHLLGWHYINTVEITRESIAKWWKDNEHYVHTVYRYHDRLFFIDWLLKYSIFKHNRSRIVVIHEKIHDYMIAHYLCSELKKPNCNAAIFGKDVTINISHFLTDLITAAHAKQQIKTNLIKIYNMNVSSDMLAGITSRQQTAFYLGITNYPLKPDQDNEVVRRGYIVGCAISGNNALVNEYCVSIVKNSSRERINLCYTLIHQGDYIPDTSTEYEEFEFHSINCHYALKGMLRQLLKPEYSGIDILAIVTINGYIRNNANVNHFVDTNKEWIVTIRSAVEEKISMLNHKITHDLLLQEVKTFQKWVKSI